MNEATKNLLYELKEILFSIVVDIEEGNIDMRYQKERLTKLEDKIESL